MPDVFTQAKRSAVMSRIRSTGNKDTEQKLAGLMRAAGITGWRRQVKLRAETWRGEKSRSGERKGAKVSAGKALQVRPDFVFRAERVAVFVDGCFCHAAHGYAVRLRNQ